MDENEIISKIQTLEKPKGDNEYSLFQLDEKNIYYGIDRNSAISFLVESVIPNVHPIVQETKYLNFSFNIASRIIEKKEFVNKKMHILTCTSSSLNDIKAFISLTEAFKYHIKDSQPYIMNELFSSLKNLFDDTNIRSDVELQGFFSELYIIYYFAQKNIDILDYWQKKDKMKFDFSINEQKRMEIKSTLKDVRIHHFKHEQLLSELYDIIIASLLLRESNMGISLYDLILKVKENAKNNYKTLLYIENFIKNIPEEKLKDLRYDEIYLRDNMKFYRANMVPRFNEKTPEGVSKAEYDSNLNNVESLSENDVIEWFQEK